MVTGLTGLKGDKGSELYFLMVGAVKSYGIGCELREAVSQSITPNHHQWVMSSL